MRSFCLFTVIVGLSIQASFSQKVVASENQKEFKAFIEDLKANFIYYNDKKEIISCIEDSYSQKVDTISSIYYKVLFYETLLNELYDSHIILNTNTDKSYRLSSPIYVELRESRFFIKNIFSSQLDYTFSSNIIGAEIRSFNGLEFQKAIEAFPTSCHDKSKPIIKEWLANKVLSGKRNETRLLGLKLSNGETLTLDIDQLTQKPESSPLTYSVQENVGIIRVNNTLGNSALVEAFDEALNQLKNTDALILDLRNTPDGGNTGVAEPIMGRFISKKEIYQVCENSDEKYSRFVVPRGYVYDKPLYVLVGRWTGSMGEGMAVGFDGMSRATIIGTEMNRLAGGMKAIQLQNSKFSFRISFEKMYHRNGTLREQYVPQAYVTQTNVTDDEFIEYAMKLAKAGK